MKLDPLPQNQLKMDSELSLGILEENIGGSSLRLGLAMIPLTSTSKVGIIRAKINK